MSVKIEFQYETQEYWAGLRHWGAIPQEQTPLQSLFGWVVVVGTLTLVYVAAVFSTTNNGDSTTAPVNRDTPHYVVKTLPLIGFVLILWFLDRWTNKYRKRFEESMTPKYPFTVTFDEDGVTIVTLHCTKQVAWASIVRFDENDTMVFLHRDKYMAHMVPKRAFPDAASLDEVRRLARCSISGAE